MSVNYYSLLYPNLVGIEPYQLLQCFVTHKRCLTAKGLK